MLVLWIEKFFVLTGFLLLINYNSFLSVPTDRENYNSYNICVVLDLWVPILHSCEQRFSRPLVFLPFALGFQ